MPRLRRAVPVLILLAAASVPPAAAQTTVDYGEPELGEIRTVCFFACFGEDCSASGTISSIDVGPPFFVRGIRTKPATSPDPCSTTGDSTPRTLPVNVSENEFLLWDVDVVPTALGEFQRLLAINGSDEFELDASVEDVSGCAPSGTAACLQQDRFKTRVHWRTNFGTRGAGPLVQSADSDDSGLYYFFDQDNWEVLLKVLNGCTINDRFWVFSAATTNVEFTITVVDTQTQDATSYFKPQGPPAPAVTDTSAFATCP